MNYMLNAAAFIAFAAFFGFLFYMAGDLWMKASQDAIEEEAQTRRETADDRP